MPQRHELTSILGTRVESKEGPDVGNDENSLSSSSVPHISPSPQPIVQRPPLLPSPATTTAFSSYGLINSGSRYSSPIKRKRAPSPLLFQIHQSPTKVANHQRSLHMLNFSPSTAKGATNKCLYSDRFIPSRTSSKLETGSWPGAAQASSTDECGTKSRLALASLDPNHLSDSTRTTRTSGPRIDSIAGMLPNHGSVKDDGRPSSRSASDAKGSYSFLLRAELFGEDFHPVHTSHNSPAGHSPTKRLVSNSGHKRRTLRFQSPAKTVPTDSPYKISPMSTAVENMVVNPVSKRRIISSVPYKVLDAPGLRDDFYLNLVDWGSNNVVAVGLQHRVFLWSAKTTRVSQLCEFDDTETVSSVSWNPRASRLAVANGTGVVQLWDAEKQKQVRTLSVSGGRVGIISWNAAHHYITMGTKSGVIYNADLRSPDPYVMKMSGHKHEVCGLDWSPDEMQLCSGGNDNKLLVWDARASSPTIKFVGHKAAVKAITWSPHQVGLLASGGGTADRHIRFWSTLTGGPVHAVDTGSQVESTRLLLLHSYAQEVRLRHCSPLSQLTCDFSKFIKLNSRCAN